MRYVITAHAVHDYHIYPYILFVCGLLYGKQRSLLWKGTYVDGALQPLRIGSLLPTYVTYIPSRFFQTYVNYVELNCIVLIKRKRHVHP